MKRTGLRVALAGSLAMLCAQGAGATTLTIDLGSLPAGPFTTPLTVDGFILTPALGASSIPTITSLGGTPVLASSVNSAQGADTFLTRVGGGAFSLLSVEIAAANGDSGHFGVGITSPTDGYAGYVYGSYFCSLHLADRICPGSVPSSLTLESYPSYAPFTDVTSIDLDPVNGGDGDVIGAITVSFTPTAAPEPATLALLGLGIAGLGAMRRRRM